MYDSTTLLRKVCLDLLSSPGRISPVEGSESFKKRKA